MPGVTHGAGAEEIEGDGQREHPPLGLNLAFAVVFLVSACGLGYQLVAGTTSSYLLGDSVTQFSFTIGLYLFALGIGSYLSKFVDRDLATVFVRVELAVAVVGGVSALSLFFAWESELWFRPLLYGQILAVGALVGIEIPLLVRLLEEELELKELIARVLSWDYVGALIAALLFPLVLVPRLGLARAALAFGLVNALVALWSVSLFQGRLRRPMALRIQSGLVVVALGVLFSQATTLTSIAEHTIYAGEIVHARTSPYQRVVVTRANKSYQLFLSGALQFNSEDEYRYHEALVHPAMATSPDPRRVLILGGGDGLACREVLRHPSVEKVVLVDLDPAVTDLARTFQPFVELNGGAFDDPRVEIINADAMAWLEEGANLFDVAIVDFPDPHSFSVGKLYTDTFYSLLMGRVAPDGAIVVQSTSPRLAPNSYWCIAETMESVGLYVRPYHAAVPSFGEWGFMLASQREFPIPTDVPDGLRFLSDAYVPTLFVLPEDARRREVDVNRLSTQSLVRYYDDELRP
ncbi:Spermidine synthase [Planctomycetes bacterium Poly30]|uniref:Polyamine aminopropyltransferase n=1 Tax=Saltatorellus ferox TaxID=2528018 RepID=A0A518ERJ7_9BACT|nr:Spermidine synthase [Planctomycetes bacterium Poly30]